MNKQYKDTLLRLYKKHYNTSNSNTEIRRKIKLSIRQEQFDKDIRYLTSANCELKRLKKQISYLEDLMKLEDAMSKIDAYKVHSSVVFKENLRSKTHFLKKDYVLVLNKCYWLLNDPVLIKELTSRGFKIDYIKLSIEKEVN